MARIGVEDLTVDLVIAPSKKRAEDDEALRLSLEADRARPDYGKASARILRMLKERERREKAKRSKRRATAVR